MRVVLGVTGCIAAYKAANVLRLLQKRGCQVLPVMTRSAQEFIKPLTFEKLAETPVFTDLFKDPSVRIEHIALARRSDLLLVAPATANCLAKFASGLADDFLSTLYVSTTTPVVLAPAMNVEMWKHASTQRNLQRLRDDGVRIVEPEAGYLACGEVGEGRLADESLIVDSALAFLHPPSLRGQRVVVSAGPTVEDLDPVRFISNRSSGKMGYAIANEAARRGADVVLVSGPTALEAPNGVERVAVRSAAEMATAVSRCFEDCQILVMSAAVADYRPSRVSTHKIKKNGSELTLKLEPTTDILKSLAASKKQQFVVGFAAETTDLLENATRKLSDKSLDLIVANDVSKSDRGFQADQNQVTLVDAGGHRENSDLMSKDRVAAWLWDAIESRIQNDAE